MRLLVLFLIAAQAAATAAEPTAFFELGAQRVEAKLLANANDRVYVLARDGKVWDFKPSDAKNVRRVSDQFSPLGANELRSQLQLEFGKRFDVGGAGQYVVVYPAGQKNLWVSRFEELSRSFQHYFSARGFRPDSPRFPLIAVVLPSQQEFVRYTIQDGVQAPPGLMGYYSATTNRVALFDATAGTNADWTTNAETIIHEATHQTAFNTGIHTRLANTPRWVTEGLGCLFEAKGVYNSSRYPRQADRFNRERLTAFHRSMARRKEGSLADFVTTDRPFETDILAAYAEAWALTFFLSETEPRKWVEYLRKTAELRPLVAERSPERLRDFTAVFGSDLRMLETRFLRFMEELR